MVRGEVRGPHPCKACLGTSPRATLSGRAALLTQGNNILEESCQRSAITTRRFEPSIEDTRSKYRRRQFELIYKDIF
jgi:hypothetical protein